MEKNDGYQTPRDINVCDDGKIASPGDPITWHNLRAHPVTVYFDTADGNPLDEGPFPIQAKSTRTNHVEVKVTLKPYEYRVVPACDSPRSGNPRIIIQLQKALGAYKAR